MKRKKYLWLSGVVLLMLVVASNGWCSTCISSGETNSKFLDLSPIPNNYYYDNPTKKSVIDFCNNVTTLTLKKRLTIGDKKETVKGPMEINVNGPEVVVKPEPTTLIFKENCAIAIVRKDVTLANFDFQNFKKGVGLICVGAGVTNIILKDIDFKNYNGQYAVYVNNNASVLLLNSEFNPDAPKSISFAADATGAWLFLEGSCKDVGLEGDKRCCDSECQKNLGESFNAMEDAAKKIVEDLKKAVENSFKCTDPNSYKALLTCLCNPGYMDNPSLEGLNCVACSGDNKEVKDGVCKCKDTYDELPADSGTCIAKCKEGEKRDDAGVCVPECPWDNTEKTEASGDDCVCKKDKSYASYDGMKNIPCVECGPGSTGISAEGECKCKNSYHVSLAGDCVSDSAEFVCATDDPNAILENKKCVCKPQFAYNVDPIGKPVCEQIPCPGDTTYDEVEGKCLSPDAIACIGKGLEWDDEAGKCLEIGAGGDCSCNFTGREPTVAQALMPFVAVLFGAGGVFVWRKRKG